MEQEVQRRWQEMAVDTAERRRRSAALRQVEWAQTYLHAAESIEVADPELQVLVSRARQALVAVELRLRRLAAV